jgi:hypothetical protein
MSADGVLTEAERRFAQRAVRRKRLFLVLSVAGLAVASALTAVYAWMRWQDPGFPVGARAALVVMILLNARQNLRQHRYASLLEKHPWTTVATAPCSATRGCGPSSPASSS